MNTRTYFPTVSIHWIYLVIIIFCISCNTKEETAITNSFEKTTLFKSLPPEQTGINFINKIKNQKNFNIFKYRNFYNGGGVAIGDINNDGLADIYFTGNMVANKLYLNKGNLVFEDISKEAGVEGNKPWSTGVTMADVNGDGLLDIYVSNAGNMKGNNHDNDLYINNGSSTESGIVTFTEKAAEYNLAKTGFTTHASFFDYDKDGDLDAYILNNSNIPVSSLGYAEQRNVRAQDWEGVPEIFRGVGDMLLRNDDGKFIDVSEKAGIYGSLIGFGLGVMVTDINKDLYPDLYVSNDFYERDYLYINNQDGTFSEEIRDWTQHLSLSAMGVDIADINNDGHLDIFITDMLPEAEERVKSVMEFEGYNVFKLKQSKDFYQQYIQNTLQLNNGNGTFSEIAYHSGVDATDWSWAGLLVDMDNDGYKDIFITNGINHDLTDLDFVDFFANDIIQKMALTGKKESIDSIINKMPIRPQPNYAFKNNKDLTFKNANSEWGFEIPSMSNGSAYGDLDNDGDLDLVVNNVNAPPFIYENLSDSLNNNNFIRLKLTGTDQNKFGIGTSVLLYFEDQIIKQEQIPSRGFQSSMDYVMTIGLGQTKEIDSIRVIWPNDQTQKLNKISANQTLSIDIKNANSTFVPANDKREKILLKEVDNQNLVSHKENSHNDFDYEGLIYSSLSQEGPALAIADIDNDGNEDSFVGGAAGQSGTIYFHQGNGNLKKSFQQTFESDKLYEDTAAAFLDADGDGDMDLIVGSGGNQIGNKKLYANRLYINDSKGNFTKASQKLPSTYQNVSVIASHDFDEDGDIDVFIGSRSVVGIYGINPDHLFLENKGDGTFDDVTEKVIYDSKDAGMITDAIWSDIDGDGRKDLVTVSDWGVPMIFSNSGRRLSKIASSLENLHGWWNSVESADLDHDGDQDLILGNQGSNLHYKPSEENPMKLWINDYDNNGTLEQIVTQRKAGKDNPIHQKKELIKQITVLKKKNMKASVYSKKSVDELFSKEIFKNTIQRQANISESVILINKENQKFDIKKLPSRVQLSCICDIACIDVNNDTHLDLVMGGNNFEFKPQYSRLDAGFGNVLLGDGKMNFDWQDYSTSGFFIRDEMKQIKRFKDAKQRYFLIAAINDQKPKVYKLNE